MPRKCCRSCFLCCVFVLLDASLGHAQFPVDPREEVVSRTYDFAPAIAAYVRRSRLSDLEARKQALVQLLTPVGHSGAPTRHEALGAHKYKIWATATHHSMLAGIAAWMKHGKQVCIETRVVKVSVETRKALHDRFAASWDMACFSNDSSPLVKFSAAAGPLENMPPAEFVSAMTHTTKQTPGRLVQLSPAEARAVQVESQPANGTDGLLNAPKITIFPDQTATIKDTTQRPFVVSVKPVKGDLATAMQPVIEVLETGLTIKLKASLNGERQLRLNGEITSSNISDVETFTFRPKASNEDVTVQLPERHVKNVRFSKVMDHGTTLLIDPHFWQEQVTKRWGRTVKSREYTLVWLTPTIVSETDLDGEP